MEAVVMAKDDDDPFQRRGRGMTKALVQCWVTTAVFPEQVSSPTFSKNGVNIEGDETTVRANVTSSFCSMSLLGQPRAAFACTGRRPSYSRTSMRAVEAKNCTAC